MLNRPNFLVLGGAKCGTTSLCHYLAQNSDVFVSPVKEPIFFDAEYERGLDYYWRRYFAGWSGQSAVGEGRVFNLFLPFVPPRIKESLPDARLIAILRDPVDRAYSHWWHRYTHRNEDLAFEDAIEKNLARIEAGVDFEGSDGAEVWRKGLVHSGAKASSYRIYLDVGLYARQIRRYLDLFPRSQLKILFYDHLRSDPQGLVREVWDFLGVRSDATLADPEPRNPAATTRRSALESALRRISGGRNPMGRLPAPLRAVADRLSPQEVVLRPPMAPETRKTLGQYYLEPNRELGALVGRDLSMWGGCEERPRPR